MRVSALLQKTCQKAHDTLDKRLNRLVLEASETLSECKQLSIFGLGRALKRNANVKHNIKTIDRLFGNPALVKNGHVYYEDCIHWLVGNNKRPIILIDWSGLTRCGEFHFLRASVPVGGRALPILDMSFRLKDYGSGASHKRFMKKLKMLLPKDCKPIIVTDAGFRCPWFKLVESFGWSFIGRVRNITQFKTSDSDTWYKVKTLYSEAQTKAKHLFGGLLAKSNPVFCHFYLMKGKKKNRIKKNLAGKKIQCSVSKKHEKRENEPWLIVASVSPDELAPNKVMNIYKKRMQIEEGFRDLKNTRNGFSLRHCRSYNIERLNVALLISAIAMLFLWVLGLAAKQKEIHYSYQANSIKTHNVLSNFTIGWQVLQRDIKKFTQNEIFIILEKLAYADAGENFQC